MNDNMRLEKLAGKLEKLEASHLENTSSSYEKHGTFYLDEVYFVFDNTLFKFPKVYLQDSPTFQQLFGNVALTSNSGIPGISFTGNGSQLKPFTCNAVKKETFEFILRLSPENPNYSASRITKEEWIDILELASRWHMDKVVTLAVSQLNRAKLDAITKLEFARKYDIQDKEWQFSAIRELVKDNKLLTEGQAYLIGYGVALRIARLQGMAHARSKPSINDDDDWKTLVDRLTKEGTLRQPLWYAEVWLGLFHLFSIRSVLSGQPSVITAAITLIMLAMYLALS